jgi:hypothetical protein
MKTNVLIYNRRKGKYIGNVVLQHVGDLHVQSLMQIVVKRLKSNY